MADLEQKLKNKTAVIGIVGLGYVGLPLALAFAQAGFRVVGVDMQQKRVDAVNKGQSYIADVDNTRLATAVSGKKLQATTDQSRLREVDAVCICVPTPLTKTKEPDLFYVTRESEQLSAHLQPGQLVVLESTTYPGTTRELMKPILERSGLKAGQDFYLAYSPERVDPGNKKYNIKNTPKIVGGTDTRSARLVELLYRQVADTVVPVSSAETAETVKLFENVFRSVNIAMVNELAQLCDKMGLSVWEVIDAASSKPFGFMTFYPGPGIGGHCIPLDPYYLASKAKEHDFHTRFIELAAEINEQMPYYVTLRIMEALNAHSKSLNGASLLVLGVTYKRDIEDMRESPAVKLIELLLKKGARISYNDPYVPEIKIGVETFTSTALTEQRLSAADLVVIATDHSSYDYQYVVNNSSLVFDSRGVTRKLSGANILRL